MEAPAKEGEESKVLGKEQMGRGRRLDQWTFKEVVRGS